MPIATPTHPTRRALLIDLDALSFQNDSRLTTDHLRSRLDAVLVVAGAVDHVLAAAKPRTLARYLTAVVELCLPVAAGVPSATAVLLDRAWHLVDVGYTEIVMATGDHRFGALCAHPTVVTSIVCAPPRALARELRTLASRVVALA